MKKIKNRITLKKITTVYVPLYFSQVDVESQYRGRANVKLTKVVVRRDSKGNVHTETKIRYETVYVEGHYTGTEDIDIIARRSVDTTVLKPLIAYYKKKMFPPETSAKPINEVDWDKIKGEVLSAEISPHDAQVYSKDEACDRTYGKVESLMSSKAKQIAAARNPGWTPVHVSWDYIKIPCKANVKWLSPLTLVPYMEAHYSFEGKVYRTVFAGWDGERVYGEEPVMGTSRILNFLGALLSGGLFGGGGAALMSYVPNPPTEIFALGFLSVLLGLAGSYYFGKAVLKDVRIETIE
jgi:hypothetical protein